MIDADSPDAKPDAHVDDPFDLAFELLEKGEDDPESILLARFPGREGPASWTASSRMG